MEMSNYFIDSDQLLLIKKVEDFLYSDTALKPGFLDKKRDMANLLNLVRTKIESQSLEE